LYEELNHGCLKHLLGCLFRRHRFCIWNICHKL